MAVDSLFIVAPIIGVLCLFLVLLCNTLCPFYFFKSNNLDGEERAGCFTLIVFPMYFDCSVALPHGAMGWSIVCDSGISREYVFSL